MKNKKMFVLMVAALLFIVGCSSGGGTSSSGETSSDSTSEDTSSEERTAENNYGLDDMDQLVVAISAGYEPFMFEEDGQLQGYDYDLLAEFENRTGVEVVYEQADFSGLLGLVESGRADVVAAQMTPTPEREENFAFTEPITYYGSTVVVHEDNEEIQNVGEDLAGKTIGVGSGNDMQQTVEDMYEDGKVKWEVYTSGTLENMLQDVSNGRLDGMLAQDVQAYVAIDRSGVPSKVLPPFEVSTGNLGVKKDNQNLLDGLDAFILDIKEDGTLSEISEKWVGTDISVNPDEK